MLQIMEADYNNDDNNTPENIIKAAHAAKDCLLPAKSKLLYIKEYNLFMEWCTKNNVTKYTEDVLLAYFDGKAKTMKSTTLASTYSKIKTSLKLYNDVDISRFDNLVAFLRQKSVGYTPKKSKTLTSNEVSRFLLEAPDKQYLMFKVALIVGIAGACRREELYKILIDDFDIQDNVVMVKIIDARTHIERLCRIHDERITNGLNLYDMCKKYAYLRPNHVPNRHFFLQYKNGSCTTQPVGINAFSKIPFLIAKYLNLSEPNAYTAQCFRRTSASLSLQKPGVIFNLNYGKRNSLEFALENSSVCGESSVDCSEHVEIVLSDSEEENSEFSVFSNGNENRGVWETVNKDPTSSDEIKIEEPEYKFIPSITIEPDTLDPLTKRPRVDSYVKAEPLSPNQESTSPIPQEETPVLEPQPQSSMFVAQLQQPQVPISEGLSKGQTEPQMGDFYEQFGKTVVGYLRQLPRPVALQCQQRIINMLVEQCMEHCNT